MSYLGPLLWWEVLRLCWYVVGVFLFKTQNLHNADSKQGHALKNMQQAWGQNKLTQRERKFYTNIHPSEYFSVTT